METRIQDPYTVLGVLRTADARAIRRAYRRLVLRYHPDRAPKEPNAGVRFQEVTAAYAILSDPSRRAELDAQWEIFQKSAARQPIGQQAYRPRPTSQAERGGAKRSGARLKRLLTDNPPLADDAKRGILGAVAFFPFVFSSMTASLLVPSPPFWVLVASGISLLLVARAGWSLGVKLEDTLHRVMTVLFRSESLADAASSLNPLVGAVVLPCLFSAFGVRWGWEFPWHGLWQAALAAGPAAAVCAAVGRAFTFADDENPRWKQGATVGGLAAGIVAGTGAFFLTAATTDIFRGAEFFALWTASAGASALGALVGAARGASVFPPEDI